jgi:hypothetical protein
VVQNVWETPSNPTLLSKEGVDIDGLRHLGQPDNSVMRRGHRSAISQRYEVRFHSSNPWMISCGQAPHPCFLR